MSEMSQLSGMNTARQSTFGDSIKATQKTESNLSTVLEANQEEASQEKLQLESEENTPMGMLIKTEKLVRKQDVKTEKAKKAQGSVFVRKEEDELADQFSGRQGNREYHLDPLLLSLLAQNMGLKITEDSEPDEVISIIRTVMTVDGQEPDVSIVDKTFDFLLEFAQSKASTAEGDEKTRLTNIYKKIEIAKNKHFESNTIEIQVAHKIIGAVDAVATTTGMSIKETMDRYRDVVHNPPDIQSLRKYFEAKGYKSMILELKGLNTYLGGNLKRTNLENPELAQLAGAARKMQGLLGVYRQAKINQTTTMESYLELNGVIAAA
jgi:hypothetical protein